MSKWDIIRVNDLVLKNEADLQTGPFGTQLKASEYVADGIPVINVRNIGYGSLIDSKLEFVSEQTAIKLKVHRLAQGDIVFGRKGAVDRHILVTQKSEKWIQGSDCLRLRIKSKDLSNKFLSYYFTTDPHKSWMEAQGSFGATMSSLNQDIVKRINIPLPPLSIQTKIVAVLSAYDDLIENNDRRITLLEKMAEEIYREWFVRLRFPGFDRATFHKGIPEGWEINNIGNLCSKVTDGSHASPDHFCDGMYMASVKDMESNGFILDSMKTISETDFRKLEKADCKPLKNDVLIAKDGSYLKHVFVWDYDLEVVLLSSIAILRPDLNKIRPYFFSLTLKQDSTKTMMSGYVSGSALPRIILNDFKKMNLMVPSLEILEKFESIANSIYQSIRTINAKNLNLRKTRDRLLTRLISGKLSVEDLDIQFPPSMTTDS